MVGGYSRPQSRIPSSEHSSEDEDENVRRTMSANLCKTYPASRDLFSVVFAELMGARKRDLCPGSKRSLIQPPSVVVDEAYKTHAPCIVC